MTLLGSGSDSEEDEEDKPTFGDGDDGDYYEQLVIIKNQIFYFNSPLTVLFIGYKCRR